MADSLRWKQQDYLVWYPNLRPKMMTVLDNFWSLPKVYKEYGSCHDQNVESTQMMCLLLQDQLERKSTLMVFDYYWKRAFSGISFVR